MQNEKPIRRRRNNRTSMSPVFALARKNQSLHHLVVEIGRRGNIQVKSFMSLSSKSCGAEIRWRISEPQDLGQWAR
jgi:hypothetical protein